MATKNKTTETAVDARDFVNTYVDNEVKKADSLKLIDLMTEWSGFDPKMWGPTIIGFGRFHYKYASGHEGDCPVLGFSPRKAEFTLYVTSPELDYSALLGKLGKHRMTKACIYFKKLADIDISVLEKICSVTLKHAIKKYDII